MTDAMFSSSSPATEHNNASDLSLEDSLEQLTQELTATDPATELFTIFDNPFQNATESDRLNEFALDAIADAVEPDPSTGSDPASDSPLGLVPPSEKSEKSVPATDIPWFNLAQKLREQNQTLIQRVVELEQVLGDTKHQSQSEIRRLRDLSNELEQSQGQIQAISQQRDIFQQESQQQRLQLEILTEQLDRTQSSLAQLERDCALLQEDNNNKTHQAVQLGEELTRSQTHFAQLERTCAQLQEDNNHKTHEVTQLKSQLQELRSRLQRQQRYTLEYKAALDQALAQHQGSPPPNPELTPNLSTLTIQPWSQANSDQEIPQALTNGSLHPASVPNSDVADVNTADVTTAEVVEPALSIEATTQDHLEQDSAKPDNSESDRSDEHRVIEPISEIEAEPLAPLEDPLAPTPLATAESLAAPEIISEDPAAEAEPIAFTAIKPYPVFTRSFSISPSFAINPSKKPAPPAKKVELPAFLRQR